MLTEPVLARPPPQAATPRFIAVASGKGGVGKTWFSITLAQALARRGRRILLVDADFGLANIDIQLGLLPGRDLGHVLAGTATIAAATHHHAQAGFDILAGSSGSGTFAGLEPQALAGFLDRLHLYGQAYHHVLLDLAAGLDASVRTAAAWAETLLLVATEEPTSLTDAYATLKLHTADRPPGPGGNDVRLVVNQAASPATARRTADTIGRAAATFLGHAPAYLGGIRRDPRVPLAIRNQAPLLARHPGSPAGHDVERIAAAL